MDSPSSVLILGAGELGTAVFEALAVHPNRSKTSLAILLRQATLDSAAPEKQKLIQRLRALNISFESADVNEASVSELASIFKKYDVVVSCTGMNGPPGLQKKLTSAALESKLKRWYPWQFGMDYEAIGRGSSQDLFDEQLDVRETLKGQDEIKWTIVSNGLFMSFLFLAAFGTVDLDEKVVRGLGSWDNTITLTTPEDIGRVTADLVLSPGDLADSSSVVYMAGDTLTYGQVGDAVDEHFGEKFTRELWDKETLKKQMEENGDDAMVKYRDTFAQAKGVSWDMERTVNYKRGIKMTDVKTYLKGMTKET